MTTGSSLPTLNDIFSRGGLISQTFDWYTPRDGQIALANRVQQALNAQEHLIAEAPTGVGKGLSYLIPAALYALTHEQPKENNDAQRRPVNIIVATANITLQEQLIKKDIPAVQDILKIPISYTLMKGRANYLCRDSYARYEFYGDGLIEGMKQEDVAQFKNMLDWGGKTETGDISELDFTPTSSVKKLLTVDSEDCKGSECDHFRDCHYNLVRWKSKYVHIIVVNYHLLLTHFKLLAEGVEHPILPSSDIIICDEAHRIPSIARDFFGDSISEFSFYKALSELKNINQNQLLGHARQAIKSFSEDLGHIQASDKYKARLKEPLSPDIYDGVLSVLKKASAEYREYVSTKKENLGDPDLIRRLKIAESRTSALHDRLLALVTLKDKQQVVYLSKEKETIYIKGIPLDVGPILKKLVFNKVGCAILTSATLRADGGSYDYIKRETGLDDARYLTVETPFDLSKQMILVTPFSMPDPNDPSYKRTAALMLKEAIEHSNGRALCLFTSYAGLNEAYTVLRDLPYRVLKQGDMPTGKLIAEFKRDIHSVLLGTDSFWEGVDAPGEACSLVTIDRLPFPPKDDPLVDAMGRESFMKYSLPWSVIKFRQAAGRLIRSMRDKGAVLVLDPRLTDTSKSYRSAYMVHFNKIPMLKGAQAISSFLGVTLAPPAIPGLRVRR